MNPQAKWLSDFVYAQLSGCCIEQKHVAQSRPIVDVKVKSVTWRVPVKLANRFELKFPNTNETSQPK